MKVGDIVTFVGAPEVQMVVTSSEAGRTPHCAWMRPGAELVACAIPEACLTLVRPSDSAAQAAPPVETPPLTVQCTICGGWYPRSPAVTCGGHAASSDEGRLRILRRVADVVDFLGDDDAYAATTKKLAHATLKKILSDEGWK